MTKKLKSTTILILMFYGAIVNNLNAQAPAITSFSPTSAKPGDVVTIIGTGFNSTNSNNVVFFGATRANVTASASNSLSAIVPTGATYGNITVLNKGTFLACASLANFNPIYTPPKNTITSNDFSPQQSFTTGFSPTFVAIGDLDGDGKPDLAVTNASSNSVSIFRNTSTTGNITNSSFATKVDFATGIMPQNVVLADLDGDGKLDLIVGHSGSNVVSLFRNTSTTGLINSFSFDDKIDFSTGPSTGPAFVAVGDLDGDGKPDIATANSISNNISIFKNTTTNGTFTNTSFSTKVDFATGFNPNTIKIFDLDGDGKSDLVTGNWSNTVSVLRNTTTLGVINNTSFTAKVDFIAGNGSMALAIGDLDGDGKPDIATGNNTSNNISILRNTATIGVINNASFASKVDFNAATGPRSITIGDIDGNGKPDIAVANWNSSSISVLINNASIGIINSTSFAPKIDFTTNYGPLCIAIGDLDGDKKSDLVSANENSATVAVLRNTDIAVPIILSLFSVSKQNNIAFLQWNSKLETNAKEYIIERSIDGNPFEKVATLNAKGSASDYTYTDDKLPNNATLVYYRLRLIDKDGYYIYSDVRFLNLAEKNSKCIKVYPNPIKGGNFGLQFQGVEKGNYILKLFNSNGQLVYYQPLSMQSNNSSQNVNTKDCLSSGLYYLQITSLQNTNNNYYQRLIVE